jgi:signal transduction histidine kinase
MMGHEASFTQCLTNLLSNAVKFVAPGVTPQVRVYSEPVDGQVRLWVEDNGIGIDAAGQERLFKIFQRLHPQTEYEGTGIGLAIVRKAVERMGGKVGVKSQAGNGSKFWIQLPAPAGDLAAPTPLPSKTSHA